MKTIDYSDLLHRFMLQRRPYISVADVLNCMYNDFLNATNLSQVDVAPFDFTLLKTQPNGRESFRWILGYNPQKFSNILNNKALFQRYADLVYSNIGQNPKLATHYLHVLKNPADFDDVEFLTAVFHLTYRFTVPNTFNVGLVHREHLHRKASYYRAILCIDKEFDPAGMPPLQIEDNPPQHQVSKEFYESEYRRFEPFYKDWTYTIQGVSFGEQKYQYIYHLYIPVYDGSLTRQRSLRGYLGIFVSREKYIDLALQYFHPQHSSSLKNINESYKKGAHNNIVDNYKSDRAVQDPIVYWRDSIDSLHQWGTIAIYEQHPARDAALFEVKEGHCYIHIGKLLDRKYISNYLDSSFKNKYQNQILSLEVPPGIMEPHLCNEESPYLRKRFREVTSLLDELLRTRYTLMVTRKSAVSAVMSRNLSHNIGSHVLARLSTRTDFPQQINSKITALNSFLRTRMDFLADLSTTAPAVATPLRIYRDTMGYFKPVFADEEKFIWQELLLDYISGSEDLKSQDIKIRFLRHGYELDLDHSQLDILFASPNGLLGTHAIYIILENLIRNSVKHAYSPQDHRHLEIRFVIDDGDRESNLIEVCLYDKLGNAFSEIEKSGSKVPLITYLNDKIKKSILDESGKLRDEAWGLLEMKICAAYLRKISPEMLDADFDPPLLEAVAVGNNLGYRFYLNRPHEILIVDAQNEVASREELNKHLQNWGSKIITRREFQQELCINIRHNFLILVNPPPDLLKEVQHNLTALPTRIFTTSSSEQRFPYIAAEELQKHLQTVVQENVGLTQFIWRRWLKHKAPQATLLVRAEKQSLARQWQVKGLSEFSCKANKILSLGPDQQYVIYDRHGAISKNFAMILREKRESRQVTYYEPVQYKQPTNFIIENTSQDRRLVQSVIPELIENGVINIVLLDERIQRVANVIKEGETTLKEVLEFMNIWMPPRDQIDLDNPQIDCDKFIAWLQEKLPQSDFLVVHLGILEKLFKDDVFKIQEKVSEYESSYPNLNILLISGRGVPCTIRHLQARFIQYSQIARYILEERSRDHLCKMLFAARRPLA